MTDETSRETAAEPAPAEQAQEPTPLQLTEVELLKLRLYQAEQLAAQRARLLAQTARDAYVRKIDPEGQLRALDSEVEQHRLEEREAHASYIQSVRAVEARLGVSLSHYVYDDVTGVLTPSSGDGDGAPQVPVSE